MGIAAYPLRAQVIGYDPENDGVYVMLPSGVIPLLVRRLYDQADGMRIKKGPLPVRGSWVYVQFPGGDIRNGMLMGSYHPNLVDSLPDAADDPFSDYESNWNGSWAYTHGLSGYSGSQWADNSSYVVGSGNLNLPTIYRHIVGSGMAGQGGASGQTRQRIPYLQTDRNPKPQPPFGQKFSQAVSGGVGGLGITMTPSGSLTIQSMVSGQVYNLIFNGTTHTTDGSGNVFVTVTSGTAMNVTVTTTTINGDLHVTGAVIAGFGTGDQVTLQNHTHAQDADSAGDTEHETHKPTAGT